MSAFEKARKHEAARQPAAAPPGGNAADPRSVLSRGAYNQALLAYAKGGDGQGALELLRCMRKAGGRLAPTRGSFNACLNVGCCCGCCCCGNLACGNLTYDRSRTFTAVI